MHYSYRRVIGSRRADNTEAEVGLEFNNTASQTVPQTNDVAETLAVAATSNSSNISLPIDPQSVKVVGKYILMLSGFHILNQLLATRNNYCYFMSSYNY